MKANNRNKKRHAAKCLWNRIINIAKGNSPHPPKTNDRHIPIYLNQPIHTLDEDIIGFSTYSDILNAAIEKDAQMIAITSPYGSGKTSITELLKLSRKQKHNRIAKEQIINIPMWSHLSDQADRNSLELHKHFVYQFAKQINKKKGTYVNRRNNPQYGLIKAFSNKNFRFVILSLLIVLSWVSSSFLSDHLQIFLSSNESMASVASTIVNSSNVQSITIVSGVLKILAIAAGLFLLATTEIVFSSHKNEGSRKIDEDEIIDIFDQEVLYHRIIKRYIVIIEDLDRCKDSKAIIDFLKELRKYTVPKSKISHCARLVFIINIKREAQLYRDDETKDTKSNESIIDLYPKLFDYVLDLQTLSIDDYITVLEGLLQEKRDDLEAVGIINKDYSGKLSDIYGMHWIIYGEKLDIRTVKQRLNQSIVIFLSLQNRFAGEKMHVSFSKCAVVAFLYSQYEKEMLLLGNEVFNELITLLIKNGKLDEALCEKTLKIHCNYPFCESFCKDVTHLINSRLIDNDYRSYFYNFPKGSKTNSVEEEIVRRAIQFDDNPQGLEEAVIKVSGTNGHFIIENINHILKLEKPLPSCVFDHNNLYCEALRSFHDAVLVGIRSIINGNDYSTGSAKMLGILRFDPNRIIYKETTANEYCEIWQSRWSNDEIIDFRLKICKAFPNEILWYKELYGDQYAIISPVERRLINYNIMLEMCSETNKEYNEDVVKDIIDLYREPDNHSSSGIITKRLVNAFDNLNPSSIAIIALEYQMKTHTIIRGLEYNIIKQIKANKSDDMLMYKYQELVNLVASEYELTKDTKEHIRDLECYERYSSHVIDQMSDAQYYTEAALISVLSNAELPDFDDENICNDIISKKPWLIETGYIETIRLPIAVHTRNILQYAALFDSECPFMTKEEIAGIGNKIKPDQLLSLWPKELVTEGAICDRMISYWNKKYQYNSYAESILLYIASLQKESAIYCFERLNFVSAIQYYQFGKKRKETVKNMYRTILNLDNITGKIHFIELTKNMDEEWISSIISNIQEDENLEKQFIQTLNQCMDNSIKKPTLMLIAKLQHYHAYTPSIEKKLFNNRLYNHYVASKILREKRFIVESVESPLWDTYITLYNHSKGQIFTYMSNNHDFILSMMKKELYKRVSDEMHRLSFASILQTPDCIHDIFENNYSSSFTEQYLSTIKGFDSHESASVFIEHIIQHEEMLKSNSIYDNTYEKLLDPKLKEKYTKKRKRLLS